MVIPSVIVIDAKEVLKQIDSRNNERGMTKDLETNNFQNRIGAMKNKREKRMKVSKEKIDRWM